MQIVNSGHVEGKGNDEIVEKTGELSVELIERLVLENLKI